MKKAISLAVTICAALAVLTGCADNALYAIYTGIPAGQLTVLAEGYSVARQLSSANVNFAEGAAAENAAAFTTKTHTVYAMASQAEIVVSDDFSNEDTAANYAALCKEAEAILYAVEDSLSATLETSSVSAFNAAEAGAEVEIDETAYRALTIAKSVYGLTDGYYNPAVYYSEYAYGFFGLYASMTAQSLPSDGEVEAYRQLSEHFAEVELYEKDGAYYAVKPSATVTLEGEELSLKIDLGGVGKGYAADMVDELFEKYGFSYGYFNFGTSSLSVKNYYKSGCYNLSFTDPRAPFGDGYMQVLVANCKISTSGDYEQYYEIDGVRYCHVIDPTTGRPVQTGIMTATVIGGSAAEDDALSTAIMAMGKDRAIAFIEEKLQDRWVVFTYEGV